MPKPALSVLVVAPLFLMACAAQAVGDTIPTARQDELLYILEQDCGSCHGLTLKGGLGPPLLPRDLVDQSIDDVAELIMDGVHGTPMPPWNAIMNADEALWLAHILKSGGMFK